MKINYNNSNTESERDWKVGDVIQDSPKPDSDLYLVSEVATDDEVLYTLIDLGSGLNLACTDTITELQQIFYEKGNKILNGTFKYTGQ